MPLSEPCPATATVSQAPLAEQEELAALRSRPAELPRPRWRTYPLGARDADPLIDLPFRPSASSCKAHKGARWVAGRGSGRRVEARWRPRCHRPVRRSSLSAFFVDRSGREASSRCSGVVDLTRTSFASRRAALLQPRRLRVQWRDGCLGLLAGRPDANVSLLSAVDHKATQTDAEEALLYLSALVLRTSQQAHLCSRPVAPLLPARLRAHQVHDVCNAARRHPNRRRGSAIFRAIEACPSASDFQLSALSRRQLSTRSGQRATSAT